MTQRCTSAQDVGYLHLCEDTINAEQYVQVFLTLFQQDNAKPQSVHFTTIWLHR